MKNILKRCVGLLIVACWLSGLVGCLNLKPTADPVKLYALGDAAVVLAENQAEGSVYVARPNLPSYLEGQYLKYRSAEGEVGRLQYARWVEPLPQGIARVLAEHLLAGGVAAVSGYYPWPRASSAASQLKVDLYRFEANAAGSIEIAAKWQLVGRDGSIQSSGHFSSDVVRWEVGDAGGMIEGMNQALQLLVEPMANSLRSEEE